MSSLSPYYRGRLNAQKPEPTEPEVPSELSASDQHLEGVTANHVRLGGASVYLPKRGYGIGQKLLSCIS